MQNADHNQYFVMSCSKTNLTGNKTYLKRYDLLHHKVERISSEAPVVSSKIVSKYSGGLQYLLKV